MLISLIITLQLFTYFLKLSKISSSRLSPQFKPKTTFLIGGFGNLMTPTHLEVLPWQTLRGANWPPVYLSYRGPPVVLSLDHLQESMHVIPPVLGLNLQLISVRLAVRVAMIHVLTVRTRMREPLQAFSTLKWLLTAVQSLVLRQVVFVLKRFFADFTLVRPLT